jgi:ATPase family associated with various cellular activities (AAA)
MTAPTLHPDHPWYLANQRTLADEVERVGRRLDRLASSRAGRAPPVELGEAGAGALPEVSALGVLVETLGLSSFERDVLLLCAGAELGDGFGRRCAAAAGDPRRDSPTFGLAMAALDRPHWSALSPAAPLRFWRLIELEPGGPVTSSPLRIDEWVLHYLAGVSYLDERLARVLRRVASDGELPPSHLETARAVAGAWASGGVAAPVVVLTGPDGLAARAVAASASAAVGLDLYAAHAADLPAGNDGVGFQRLWERNAALAPAALLIDLHEADGVPRGVLALAETLQGRIALAARQPLRVAGRAAVRLDLQAPTVSERHDLWQRALGPAAASLNGALSAVADQFDLSPTDIRLIGGRFGSDDDPGAPALAGRLWDACRSAAAARLADLGDLARRIDATAGWDELVIPATQRQTLREIVLHVRHRFRVHHTWGFAARGARGLGINALFAGPSGTGKTMAAEVLARELGLDLFRIDLSAVVSKYIGETEKNLRRVFDAAEGGGAVLLFDEADALFGKRSEVRDSHDRYANIEVSYLLQRMESYRGLSVLTTNQKQALDGAFLRRLRAVVPFPFPDAPQRAEIWRRVFPPETPTEGLDMNRLARLNVSGGHIRNIAVSAAVLAAEHGSPVRMAHVAAAARSEYAKLEKPLTEAEIGGWT